MGAVPKATLQGYITECSTCIKVLCDQIILALYWTSFSSYNTGGSNFRFCIDFSEGLNTVKIISMYLLQFRQGKLLPCIAVTCGTDLFSYVNKVDVDLRQCM